MEMHIIRQGDLALIPIARPPIQGTPRTETLAIGEDSGHAHVLDCTRDGDLLTVTTESTLRVEPAPLSWRHDPITVPPGTYRIVVQREWNAGEARDVQD